MYYLVHHKDGTCNILQPNYICSLYIALIQWALT